MRQTAINLFPWLCLFLFAMPSSATSTDMRSREQQIRQKKTEILKELREDRVKASKEGQLTASQIQSDRQLLLQAVKKLENENRLIKQANRNKRKELEQLANQRKQLLARFKSVDAVSRELTGFIRVNAKDLDVMISRSLQSAFIQERGLFLQQLLESDTYPGMGDARRMVELLTEEIELSGEVRITEQSFVARSGETETAPVLVLGNFTTAYRSAEDTGFALFSEKSSRLFALSKLPSSRVRKQIEQYMEGRSESVPIDITRGSALRQISGRLDLFEQIAAGGPVVWPILGIFILGILIIAERTVFLVRRRLNPERLVDQVSGLALAGRWGECSRILTSYGRKPLAVVLKTALNNRTLKREDMENALQETILGQIPPLERFLSTLGMIASIAPLLGLLGTVTGMINTFHTITTFGTGDARMMSGGISEALVTTMLGLAVAIPIMFAHTLLSRFVENQIAQMEEKAVAFVNTIEKSKEADAPATE